VTQSIVEISQIRAGIVANIKAVVGNTSQVTPYKSQSPTPPTIQVTGFGEIIKVAMGSWEIDNFLVQGLAGAPTQESAQMRLDTWLSPLGATNIWTAIESDKTLGGIVNNAIVTRCDGAQFIETPSGEVLGSTWHIQIEL
jgi:hypothetical protein